MKTNAVMDKFFWLALRLGFPLCCVILVLVLLLLLFIKSTGFKKEELIPRPFNTSLERNYGTKFKSIPQFYKTQVHSKKPLYITRNIFTPLFDRDKKLPFYLKEIMFEPLFFMYKGHIEKSPGVMIAQINWGEKTYFVQKGDRMQNWTILNIEKEHVIVKSDKGEELTLHVHKQTFSKNPYAVFKMFASENEVKVKVGDQLEGYKVLDIRQDAVILSKDSQTISVTK
jgi:hypothetical protein